MDAGFSKIFQQSIHLAERVGAEVSMPRIARLQQHRSNPEASSPEDYFRKSVAIPLLDHILSTLEAPFSKAAAVASSLLGVVRSVCCSSEVDLDEALQKYGQDLPSPELFAAEFSRWKRRFRDQPVDKLPASPAEAIKVCDPDMFPNVSILLH